MEIISFKSIADQEEEKKWKKQFARVASFKKKTGMLPTRKTDHTLFYWLVMQRKKAKEGRLTEEQLKLYADAGINVLGRSQKA